MLPPPRAFIKGTACFVHRNGPFRQASRVWSQSCLAKGRDVGVVERGKGVVDQDVDPAKQFSRALHHFGDVWLFRVIGEMNDQAFLAVGAWGVQVRGWRPRDIIGYHDGVFR